MTKVELQTEAMPPASRCFYNITFYIKAIYVKMTFRCFLLYFLLTIFSQVFRTYYVLCEENHVGRSMLQNTLNICNNKTFVVATDGLLAGLGYPPMPANLKMT